MSERCPATVTTEHPGEVGLGCFDCGLLYGGPGWCDTHVPSDVWTKISPTGNEGGILCLTCMARRIEALGLDDVPLMVTSGPWTNEPTSTYQEGWHTGHKVAAAENAALRSRLDEVAGLLMAYGEDVPGGIAEFLVTQLRAVLAPAHDEGSDDVDLSDV